MEFHYGRAKLLQVFRCETIVKVQWTRTFVHNSAQ